jgi:molybdopterin converting factor small subunit
MKIFVRAFGPIQAALGQGRMELEVEENACVSDVISLLVNERILPVHSEIWDLERQQFNFPVVIMVQNQDVQDMKQVLSEGQEIFLVAPMAGG